MDIMNWLQEVTGLGSQTLGKIITSIIIVVFLWLVRLIILRIVWKRVREVTTRYHWQKWLAYITSFIGLLLIGRVWFAGFGSLATYLGLLSAGLAIALKELVAGIAGWMFLLWRKPFQTGDRVQIGSRAGDVIDIRLFKFTLLEIGNWVDADQSTGRIQHLPNSMVLSDVITNYSQGFKYIWNEIPVLITFESNWRKAKQILQEICEESALVLTDHAEQKLREASKRYMIFFKSLTPIVYTSTRDSGVLLTMRFLVDPRQRRTSEHQIWESILTRFETESDIDYAYPTQRFYNNITEGKPNARAGS